MIKYFPILIVAIFIDGFVMAVSLSILGIGTVGSAAVSWIPLIGQAAAGAITGAGSALGVAISFSLNVTFGAALLIFLIYSKIFDPRLFILGGGEVLPFLNILPFWTGLTWASIYAAHKKKKRLGSSEEGAAEGTDDLSFLESDEMRGLEESEEVPQSRQVDGIRAPQTVPTAANDNHLQQKLVA